ncbi:hypothetical protein KZ810_00670 [Sphingomonas sp. RHCKR47]|uniref:hypothetical protein n=1 Tax=Sphingomonas citricola TaxID=2862498 RepID=UPI001CA4AD78|nr:hypothetical protein [Sphingomonas citricola]MBW6521999.1 hypothetical protein [Sphingomonas citricola]
MTGAPLQDTLQQAAITGAVLRVLHINWPQPTDLSPAMLGLVTGEDDRLYVQAIGALVDEGLVSIEALLIGTPDGPVARGALLTRKAAATLEQVTRPM